MKPTRASPYNDDIVDQHELINNPTRLLWIKSVRLFLICFFVGKGLYSQTGNLGLIRAEMLPAFEQQIVASSNSRQAERLYNAIETVIFYNIFIPTGRPIQSMNIVKEQLKTREDSVLKGKQLIYTLITPQNVSETATQIEAMEGCQPCKAKVQTASGDESLTLTQLYEHCQEYPNNRVVYMHSKGSFTPTRSNDILRRLSMKAVTSHECNDKAATALSNCTVCSAYFTGYPFFIVTGNFFVAQCSYINKLLPPLVYQAKKGFLFEQLGTYKRNVTEQGPAPEYNFSMSSNMTEEGKKIIEHRVRPVFRWQVERKSWIAVERYAMEHWVHSHPSVNPCDVHPTWRGRYDVKSNAIINFEPSLLGVPSHRTARYIQKDFPTWYNLPGRLFEWKFMYDELPANDSWVWKHFAGDEYLASRKNNP